MEYRRFRSQHRGVVGEVEVIDDPSMIVSVDPQPSHSCSAYVWPISWAIRGRIP